jgi:hypothetical protein
MLLMETYGQCEDKTERALFCDEIHEVYDAKCYMDLTAERRTEPTSLYRDPSKWRFYDLSLGGLSTDGPFHDLCRTLGSLG